MFQGFVVTLNSTGSGVWPGGGVAAWYQSPSAATKEASSLSEEEEEEEEEELSLSQLTDGQNNAHTESNSLTWKLWACLKPLCVPYGDAPPLIGRLGGEVSLVCVGSFHSQETVGGVTDATG